MQALNAEWHAVYVETPALQRLPPASRERILGTLNLAQELGATTAVIADADVANSVIAYARNHNLSKLVIGRDPARRRVHEKRGRQILLAAAGRRDQRPPQTQGAALPLGGARLRGGDAA